MSFSNAPEAREIATKYINLYHQHLANAPIEYVFNQKTVLKKGKEVLGEAKLLSGLNAFLITRDQEEPLEQIFVITISRPAWDLLEDKKEAREAIIDHELAHLFVTEEGGLSILPHDIEEFNEVVRRHGPWKQDIANFLSAAKSSKVKQIPFDFSLARENQEKDNADRDQREHDSEIDDERAASTTGVRLVKADEEKPRKGKGKGEEQERQAAAGE